MWLNYNFLLSNTISIELCLYVVLLTQVTSNCATTNQVFDVTINEIQQVNILFQSTYTFAFIIKIFFYLKNVLNIVYKSYKTKTIIQLCL